jgi:hypothetical protein
MGEHKLPKTPPKRPSADILGMRSSVAAWESQAMGIDPDTNDFMRALRNLIKWVDELESATDPFAAVVPNIDPTAHDSDDIRIMDGPDLVTTLTVGDFRRLNPAAAKAAVN